MKKLFLASLIFASALIASSASATTNAWEGEWVRENSFEDYYSVLTIKKVDKKSFNFSVEGYANGNVCTLVDEKAVFIGSSATSSPYSTVGDKNNVLDPNYRVYLNKDGANFINISESNDGGETGAFCGLKASIEGDYIKNGEIKKRNSSYAKNPVIKIDAKEVAKFKTSVPAAYKNVAVVKQGDLYLADVNGKILKRFTTHKSVQSFLRSPDGNYIAYIHLKGDMSHPGIYWRFTGTMNLKIVSVATGKEMRNIFLAKYESDYNDVGNGYVPDLSYFWDQQSKNVNLYFNQYIFSLDSKQEIKETEKKTYASYSATKNTSKFLTADSFKKERYNVKSAISGSANITWLSNNEFYNKTILENLFEKISGKAKDLVAKRYNNYDYIDNVEKALTIKQIFVNNTSINFSPNLKRAVVYMNSTSGCDEDYSFMDYSSSPLFIINLTTGEVIEEIKPMQFLTLTWLDDNNFLAPLVKEVRADTEENYGWWFDNAIYKFTVKDSSYSMKRFLTADKNFKPKCTLQGGPGVGLPCDGLGESLGPVYLVNDHCGT